MEVNAHAAVVPVIEVSQIGEARRIAATLAASLGFSETRVGQVALVATELATNLVRHASKGRLLVQPVFNDSPEAPLVELIAIDHGPGMTNVDRCLEDGYSTAGTAGQGLGAVRRLSAEFDLYSTPGAGTAIIARVTNTPSLYPPRRPFRWGCISIAAPGETTCGDRFRVLVESGRAAVVVADGLGHGPLAAEAAGRACLKLASGVNLAPDALLRSMHPDLIHTRGAAVAVACVDIGQRVLRYAGVGNIAGWLVAPGESRGLLTHNGIVGKQMRRVQELDYPFPANGLLLMCSDGLQTRWSFDRYPGLMRKHPSVIAATLTRDYQRGRDDLSVFVASLSEQATELAA